MTYSVENWSEINNQDGLKIITSSFAIVDLFLPIKNLDGEIEFELLCICPTGDKAVKLVHLLNKL